MFRSRVRVYVCRSVRLDEALATRLPRSNVRELVMGTHLGGNPLGEEGVQAGLTGGLPSSSSSGLCRPT